MTNNILDVLTYMFDYLFEVSDDDAAEIDDTTLKAYLSDAGFEANRINKALNWLENIAVLQDGEIQAFSNTQGGVRIYHDAEKIRLDAKARGFLLFMENVGQITAIQREIVIEQVMSLDESSIHIDDLKWITMMVIGNSDTAEVSPEWLESIVFLDDNRTVQ
ncbi:MAG: Protein Smg [Catillopecten margaritatus gill symbiont]|uniref:Protein Smg homolog n=1 Tax=Catillopecten margaritatus gill symbiont TaxID=3083288 RepID=A0AAU6PGM5_9GAMM